MYAKSIITTEDKTTKIFIKNHFNSMCHISGFIQLNIKNNFLDLKLYILHKTLIKFSTKCTWDEIILFAEKLKKKVIIDTFLGWIFNVFFLINFAYLISFDCYGNQTI